MDWCCHLLSKQSEACLVFMAGRRIMKYDISFVWFMWNGNIMDKLSLALLISQIFQTSVVLGNKRRHLCDSLPSNYKI